MRNLVIVAVAAVAVVLAAASGEAFARGHHGQVTVYGGATVYPTVPQVGGYYVGAPAVTYYGGPVYTPSPVYTVDPGFGGGYIGGGYIGGPGYIGGTTFIGGTGHHHHGRR